MNRAGDLRFKRRDDCERGVELRASTSDIELRAAPAFETSLGDLHRLGLVSGVSTGDFELVLSAAQFEVVANHLGDDADEHIATSRFGRLRLRARGFGRATHATEQVQFPDRVEADTVDYEMPVCAW